ncbi:MAG: HAD-IB family phosphatase [Spirochaetota bacterium]|nr:HAD-IB family phosphatase [Spirochaetota bacterium]
MIKLSLYDFDKTIYKKDTGIVVLKYLFKKHPKTLLQIPKIVLSFTFYFLKIIPTHRLKEIFFSPISILTKEEWETFITDFWAIEKNNLFPNTCEQIEQDKKNGYIIGILSASAEIMLYPIMDIISIDFLIGTIFSTTESTVTSTIIGKNCKNEEKVSRLYKYIEAHYPNQKYTIDKMYSDSLHDLPLFNIAQQQFTVEANGTIRPGLPNPNNHL